MFTAVVQNQSAFSIDALINGFGNGVPSGIRMLPSVTFPIVYLIVRGWPPQLMLQGTSVGHGLPPITKASAEVAVHEGTMNKTNKDNESFCERLKERLLEGQCRNGIRQHKRCGTELCCSTGAPEGKKAGAIRRGALALSKMPGKGRSRQTDRCCYPSFSIVPGRSAVASKKVAWGGCYILVTQFEPLVTVES